MNIIITSLSRKCSGNYQQHHNSPWMKMILTSHFPVKLWALLDFQSLAFHQILTPHSPWSHSTNDLKVRVSHIIDVYLSSIRNHIVGPFLTETLSLSTEIPDRWGRQRARRDCALTTAGSATLHTGQTDRPRKKPPRAKAEAAGWWARLVLLYLPNANFFAIFGFLNWKFNQIVELTNQCYCYWPAMGREHSWRDHYMWLSFPLNSSAHAWEMCLADEVSAPTKLRKRHIWDF